MSDPTALDGHRQEGDGVELDVRAAGTWVDLTLTSITGEAVKIQLSADQAGELGEWLVAHRTRVDLPPGT